MHLDRASLNIREGHVVCRPLSGGRQHVMLVDPAWAIGGAELVWRRSVSFLHVTPSHAVPAVVTPAGGTLGVNPGIDLGIVNRATDSAEGAFTGALIHPARTRYHPRRRRLQTVNSKNTERRLRKHAGRERRDQQQAKSTALGRSFPASGGNPRGLGASPLLLGVGLIVVDTHHAPLISLWTAALWVLTLHTGKSRMDAQETHMATHHVSS
jgi:hypothetical protein